MIRRIKRGLISAVVSSTMFLASIENQTKSDKLFDSYDKNSGGKQLLLVGNSLKNTRASVSPILLAPLL